jgi:uncharacterized membrane protein
MAGFMAVIGAFVWAGRVGAAYNHSHAARVLAIAITIIVLRAIRTWIGKEQVRYRAVHMKKSESADEL